LEDEHSNTEKNTNQLNMNILKNYKFIEVCPDYSGGSIVNLMSSIRNFFEKDHNSNSRLSKDALNIQEQLISQQYPPLNCDIFDPEINKKTENIQNVFLIIIDGLGYNYLNSSPLEQLNLFLKRNIRLKLTSVTPSTTAAAITSFLTGLAPKNHGIPAWYTYFKEVGIISIMPPMLVRDYNFRWINKNINITKLFNFNSIFRYIKARCYYFVPSSLMNTPYTFFMGKSSQMIGIENFNEMLEFGINIINNIPGKKFLVGYWPSIDSLSHNLGIYAPKTINELQKIDETIENFITKKESKLKNSLVILTADHGLIDINDNNRIFIENQFDNLKKTLTMPLCGEARLPFCYVRPSKVSDFKNIVLEKMADFCEMISVEDFINTNILGYFNIHPKLFDRLGDYILIMKKGFVLCDVLATGKIKMLSAYHGGFSADEMLVPLIFW